MSSEKKISPSKERSDAKQGNVLMGKRLKKFCFSEEKQFNKDQIIYNLN